MIDLVVSSIVIFILREVDLRETRLLLREIVLRHHQAALRLREVALRLRQTVLRLREVALRPRHTVLRLREGPFRFSN